MASTTRRLAFSARRCSSKLYVQTAQPRFSPLWQRPLSTSSSRRADETPAKDGITTPELADLIDDMYGVQEQVRSKSGPTWQSIDPNGIDQAALQEQGKDGFWSEGEEELGPDEDYYADDITSDGHQLLEQHRELREYARMIAWELPLLNHLARPFEVPTQATPFRFRYTSYLGERHPAVNKVVVEFCAKDMKLSPIQTDKLIKLAGVRYNPSNDTIKLSCEKFDTQAQNKRFLGETISKLLTEAKDGSDTFADVPFDFRHHKPKPVYEFPESWILTPERKKYLEEKRSASVLKEEERKFTGALIDGNKVVESNLPRNEPEPVPVMIGGRRGKALR
ncbi:unnamed protein product [Periconia digitata]|uniref:Small ribosomal subunit protein mS35 mitochondrial conserved domain-containing protein n=1 Tax=Periconia digitata TaxID=1303443 RepID=A0A9W4XMI2_9PLEO|nr:unnamed protein product [Periconia digitata]